MGYNTHVPDFAYWKRMIACQHACPVHTDARAYVRAIAGGNDELAYLIARGLIPLASICGRVCRAPCEKDCRRGSLDKPIAIRALNRCVCEQFGVEARADGGRTLIEFLGGAARRHPDRQCSGPEELLPLLHALTTGKVPPVKGLSVGIIGSGRAGLAAAHDLAILGFAVTICESEPVLAGMLRVGILEYRLPRDLIAAEVEVITALGVKAVTNCRVGEAITFPELRARHDAIVVAAGAKRSRRISLPGSDAPQVLGGVEFLRDVARGKTIDLGRRVVVIGGGNVAFDVRRTVLRQISLDTARSALRESGVSGIYLCSLESLEGMPADDVGIIEGGEEGIIRRNSLGPKEVLCDAGGRVRGVRFQECLRVFDEQRRFNPQCDPNEITEIECDTVLLSVGQTWDLSFVDAERDQLKLKPNGLTECDPAERRTSVPDVFVAGDLAHGMKLLIHAVASGKAVARSSYQQLTGRPIMAADVELQFAIARYQREPDDEKIPRVHLRTLSAKERVQSQRAVVEQVLIAAEARRQASRCLNCGLNTILDGRQCILCGGCADVCPELCLRLVPLDWLGGNGPADRLNHTIDDQLAGMPRAGASSIAGCWRTSSPRRSGCTRSVSSRRTVHCARRHAGRRAGSSIAGSWSMGSRACAAVRAAPSSWWRSGARGGSSARRATRGGWRSGACGWTSGCWLRWSTGRWC